MVDEKQNEETKEEPKAEEGKPEEKNSTEKLSELVERAEKANEETKSLLARQEELVARKMLGGETDAGEKEVEKVEETPKEYKDKIMRGELPEADGKKE